MPKPLSIVNRERIASAVFSGREGELPRYQGAENCQETLPQSRERAKADGAAIPMFSIVAWRLLWLTLQARETPEVPCTLILEEFEWKPLCAAVLGPRRVPAVASISSTAERGQRQSTKPRIIRQSCDRILLSSVTIMK
jgi:hypothetical protein